MNIIKTFQLKWWQGSIFKIATLTAGIAIGAYWHDFFADYLGAFIAAAIIAGAYITVIWWRQ